ncbi:MAG: hydrolase [Candidatus Tectomicrobia bacterium]|nr:hydrolase [Candidatus Tectomicrobia bacterium]
MDRYAAVAVQSTFLNIQCRDDMKRNLDHLAQGIRASYWLASLEYPVKLICFAEGAIQGFPDSMFDWDHVRACKELMTTVPGPETDYLADIARELNVFIAGQIRAVEAEIIEDRYFNLAFVIDPKGKIVHKYHKLQVYPNEPSTVPHDVWDLWIEKFGYSLDSFYPVCDTEIGRIGTIICMDQSFPETARGLAMNGAEVIYMPTYVEPWAGRGWSELRARTRALDNTCYVIAPNPALGMITADSPHGWDITGGNTIMCDYKGEVISHHIAGTDSFCSAMVDIEALRDFRDKSLFGNWLKDLRTEQYKVIYEQPIFPKNLFLHEPPPRRAGRQEIHRQSTRRLQERGVWKRPKG